MRKNGAVTWLHSDHLGSASLATDAGGAKVDGSDQRYKPFGEKRFLNSTQPSKFGYTGQRDFGDFGMMDYGARMYSPALGRFLSADSIVPSFARPQSLNRYAYVENRPMVMVDPTGHAMVTPPNHLNPLMPNNMYLGKIAHYYIEMDFVLNVAPGQSYGDDLLGGRALYNQYQSGNPDIYYTPGRLIPSSLGDGGTIRLYEIKHRNDNAGISAGRSQLNRYLSGCASCELGEFYPSNVGIGNHREIAVDPFGLIRLQADLFSGGLILYSWDTSRLEGAIGALSAAELLRRLMELYERYNKEGERLPQGQRRQAFQLPTNAWWLEQFTQIGIDPNTLGNSVVDDSVWWDQNKIPTK